jgi:hypothetical protein
MMEALGSSEMPVLTIATRCNISGDRILQIIFHLLNCNKLFIHNAIRAQGYDGMDSHVPGARDPLHDEYDNA